MNNKQPKPHPHAELIKAWADGAKIQSRALLDYDNVEQWTKWTDNDEPEWWNEDYQFRVKPKKRQKASGSSQKEIYGDVTMSNTKTKNNSKPHPHAELICKWANEGVRIQKYMSTVEDWRDDANPQWLPQCKYRIKPEESWKPKDGDWYYHFDQFFKIFHDVFYNSSRIDEDRVEAGNCFQTFEAAEAAISCVKTAPKGTADVINNVGINVGINVGSNVGSVDGKPLTDGEIALIKALRKTWGFAEIIKPGDAVVVSKNKNDVYKSTTHNISLLLIDGEGSDDEIVEALKLINEEHKIDNERALRDLDIKAGQILRDATK